MNRWFQEKRGRVSSPFSFQKIFQSRKGSSYFDLMIKTFVVITLMATVMSFLSIFSAYLNLSHVCRRVVRAIELEGQVSDRVQDIYYRLKQQTGISPDMVVENVEYFDGQNQKIQLRTTFTVTMTYNYAFKIFTPSFAPPVQITIPMRVSITGMSEKYWKPSG